MTHFIYSPLNTSGNEIRLVDLEPSQEFGAPLRCQLRTVCLDTDPGYDALSWCWGPNDGSGVLFVDDQKFPCRPNLENALRNLRDHKVIQTFWVDAVCINQLETVEKSSQIMLMGQIYSKAQIVKVWLGEATDDSDEGVDILRQLQHRPNFKQFSPSQIQAFVHLIQRPWWTRIWVVQEVLLAQTVVIYCGSTFFQLEYGVLGRVLRGAVMEKAASIEARVTDTQVRGMSDERLKLEDDLFQTLTKAISSFVMAEHSVKSARTPIATLKTMLQLGPLQATDLRDKVYGCLGMLPEIACRLKPDYSAPLATVFSDATFSLIDCLQTLHPLCYHQKSIKSGLPSWSLRFDRGGEIHEELPRLFRAWAADGWDEWQMPRAFSISECDGVVLTVQGSCLDEIVTCYPTLPDWTAYYETSCQLLNKWLGLHAHYLFCHRRWRSFFGLHQTEHSVAAYVAGGSMEEAYWNTASFNVRYLNGSKDLRKLSKDDITTVIETMDYHNKHHTRYGEGPITVPQKPPPLIRDYDFGVMGATAGDFYPMINGKEQYGTCFFVTSRGYIGLAHHEVKPGDQVFILNRATLPMVLRPHEIDESMNVYEVMSASYVHGVMQGEVFKPQASSEVMREHELRVKEFGGRSLDTKLPLKMWDEVHLM